MPSRSSASSERLDALARRYLELQEDGSDPADRSDARERLAAAALARARAWAPGLAARLSPFPQVLDPEGAASLAVVGALDAWEKSGRTRSRFQGLLGRVLRRRLVDQVRTAAGRPGSARARAGAPVSLDGLLEMPDGSDRSDPSDQEAAAERLAEIFRRVPLTDREHEVLCVLYLCGGRHASAAEVLGLVESRIFQVVQSIRAQIRRAGLWPRGG